MVFAYQKVVWGPVTTPLASYILTDSVYISQNPPCLLDPPIILCHWPQCFIHQPIRGRYVQKTTPSALHLSFDTGSLTTPGAHCLTSKLLRPSCLYPAPPPPPPPPPPLGLHCAPTCLAFMRVLGIQTQAFVLVHGALTDSTISSVRLPCLLVNVCGH